MRNKFSIQTLLLAASHLSYAFQIHGTMLTLTRLDPIVNPGAVSSHAHMVIGGSNFGSTLTSQILEESQCSTLEIQQDKSAYWVSPPYGQNGNGSWSALPVTSVSIYYKKVQNQPIVPFPENFRMLIGNPSATEKNLKDPFMSYQCQNFIPQGDPTGNWNFSGWERLPTMDCTRIKLATTFPNCWDGINADSANHRDHVHNDLGDGITCPPSHPKRIAQITLEIDFWANDYKWQDIALSSGSKSGWGIHADYYFGWADKGAILNKALSDPTCVEAQGVQSFYPADQRCETLVPYAVDEHTIPYQCAVPVSVLIPQEEVGMQRSIPELPGCNPRFDGPGYPTAKPACGEVVKVPRIGMMSRLFEWWDKDPRHAIKRNMPVFDGFNGTISGTSTTTTMVTSTRTPTSTPTSVQPTSSGTLYLTTGQNWDGSAVNLNWKGGVCVTLSTTFRGNVGSAGPNTGSCAFWSDLNCGGSQVLTMKYPGRSSLGSVGKKVNSFSCI